METDRFCKGLKMCIIKKERVDTVLIFLSLFAGTREIMYYIVRCIASKMGSINDATI